MTRLLLEQGCPADARSAEGATALMNAVQGGNLPAFELLLGFGADVNAADHRGFTALHRAAEMGRVEMVRRLLAAGALAAPEAQGHTPLSLARLRHESEVVRMLESATR
jgi:ankyrin repeat protein